MWDSDYIAEIEAPRIGPNDRFAAATGVRFERDPTKVFYGFGPDSREEDKSGLIQRQYRASLSAGINLLEFFRVSYNERLRVALIEDGGGSQDPFIGDTFSDASGVRTWEHHLGPGIERIVRQPRFRGHTDAGIFRDGGR